MGWPNIPVSSNKRYRATLNGVYGAPLVRIYPAGTFMVSNTSGSPGQPMVPRIMPSGQNQATDPRAANAAYIEFLSRAKMTTAVIGGNSYSNTTASPTDSSSTQWILWGAVALIAWVLLR